MHDLMGMSLRPDQLSISVVSCDAKLGKDLEGLTLQPLSVGGLGAVAAGGPMAQYLSTEAAQANDEALIAALVKMGATQDEAMGYVDGVRKGYTLEAAIVDDEKAPDVLAILKQHTREVSPLTAVGPSETTIPIVEEELRVGRRDVLAGGVRASTHVVEKPVTEEITLKEDRISVERRATEKPVTKPEEAFREQTVEILATAEEPVVEKTAHVVEEVILRKEPAEHIETVTGTVRRTDIDVRKIQPFEASSYEQHFGEIQKRRPKERLEFKMYEPAYRFGHDLRGESRFGGPDWMLIESDVKTVWETKSPDTWERFKEAIRHAWEKTKE
jgi:uncharacterized protein (TIGR02271 family)